MCPGGKSCKPPWLCLLFTATCLALRVLPCTLRPAHGSCSPGGRFAPPLCLPCLGAPITPHSSRKDIEYNTALVATFRLPPPAQDSIKSSQQWFMACAGYAAGLVRLMARRLVSLGDYDKQLHIVYLANDILFKA